MCTLAISKYRPPLVIPCTHTPPSPHSPVVAAGETNGPVWGCASFGSLAAIHRHPAPQWQAEAVGRTPMFVGERVQNGPLATTQCPQAPHALLFHPLFVSPHYLSMLH